MSTTFPLLPRRGLQQGARRNPRAVPGPQGRVRRRRRTQDMLPGAGHRRRRLLWVGTGVETIDLTRRLNPSTRDRAVRLIRYATFGGLGGAVGLTGIFSLAAVATFSGKPVATTLHPTPPPPPVPMAAAPAQVPPPTPAVVEHVVHHPAYVYSGSGSGSAYAAAPRPPGQAPVAVGAPAGVPAPVGMPAPLPPPPPPPPVCHSTPSAPC